MVIGALGTVGTEVVRQVLARGGNVRAADMDVNKIRERFGEAVEAVRFDFTDPSTFEETFRGVKRMFCMRPPYITNIHRDMVPSMDAAKRAGVIHGISLPDRDREH